MTIIAAIENQGAAYYRVIPALKRSPGRFNWIHLEKFSVRTGFKSIRVGFL
jgi:hypothetical protein